jgi:hypothetical protein
VKARTFILATGLFLCARSASAQEMNLANATADRPNVVAARTGVDHAFVGELGYTRVVDVSGRRLFLGGELQMPWASFDFDDYRVRAGGSMVLLGESSRRWQLAGSVMPTVRGAKSSLARTTSLGTDLRLTGGYYAPGGFIAAQLGFDWAMTTRVSNSDLYRRTVYADAQDGWYGNTGGTAYAALVGGLSFGRWDVVMRAGVPRNIDGSNQTIPAFATIGVSVPLPWGERSPSSSPTQTVGQL